MRGNTHFQRAFTRNAREKRARGGSSNEVHSAGCPVVRSWGGWRDGRGDDLVGGARRQGAGGSGVGASTGVGGRHSGTVCCFLRRGANPSSVWRALCVTRQKDQAVGVVPTACFCVFNTFSFSLCPLGQRPPRRHAGGQRRLPTTSPPPAWCLCSRGEPRAHPLGEGGWRGDPRPSGRVGPRGRGLSRKVSLLRPPPTQTRRAGVALPRSRRARAWRRPARAAHVPRRCVLPTGGGARPPPLGATVTATVTHRHYHPNMHRHKGEDRAKPVTQHHWDANQRALGPDTLTMSHHIPPSPPHRKAPSSSLPPHSRTERTSPVEHKK